MTEVRLFDANAMIGPVPAAAPGHVSPAQLLDDMDRLGIDQALVFHGSSRWHDPAIGNREVLEECAVTDRRLLPVWVALPAGTGEIAPAERFVADMRTQGVAAVRVFPAEHGYSLAGPDVRSMLTALAQQQLPLIVDADQANWDEIEAVAVEHPALPLVICAVGYRSLRRIVGVLERRSGVLLDLSYLASHCGVEWLADRFGASRLVFGTGAPTTDGGGAVTRLLLSELQRQDVERIAAGNLQRLLRLAAA